MASFDTYFGAGNLDEGRVVEWLNNAALSTTTSEKSQLLRKVQEVVINKSPHLLNQFLSEILAFTTDRDAEIKKWLVGFIEEACKKNEQSIDKVMPNLHMLLCDESIQVQKRVIQAATSIYRNMLSWLAKALQITDSMEQAWTRFSNIKIEILNMVDSDNDGIRTHSVKFLEGVVLLQTYPEPGLPRKENDFSLEDIPLTLKFARRRKLEEEAHHIFSLLVKFHGSPHISSVNLMACMGALCTIAKSRPIFMPHVVTALEDLNNNLPPTLTPSQVNSVRKHLKLQLINILKHPSSIEVQSTVISLASELGYSSQEISKLLPRIDEYQRRNRNFKRNSETIFPSLNKRPRFDPTDMEVDDEELNRQKQEACKLNEQFIVEKLKIDTATHLVMEAMKKLPDVIPNHFITNYTPAANAGTPAHLKQVAKILAVQFTDAGVGPGMNCLSKDPPMRMKIPAEVEDAIIKGPTKKESELIEEKLETISQIKAKDEEKIIRSTKPRIKTLRLDQITRPLNAGTRELMLIKSVERILQSEQAANTAGASLTRNKIITTLASTFGPAIREAVLKFILKDIRLHIDLALAWLYEEYSFMQGFNRMSAILRREAKPDQSYNTLLCALIANMEAETRERDHLLMRLFLESPYITEEAVEMLKRICIQENRAAICMGLLQELVCRRPPKYMTFLNVLLHYTAHEIAAIRDEAITRILQLYERQELQSIIEEQSLVYLCFLTQPQPPPILFGDDRGRPQVLDNWNDESSKACLYLYLALLPSKESLVHELSRVYIQTTADVKRTILRLLEQPIRGMGMESTELLALVEHCPKGAETLITRVIHILTERGSPSAILVNKVRELYQTRVSDVRFLIPVLNGLTKKEVIAALPKLIKLNPVVVKEVFNRLLGAHSEGPITPAELLIALHMIDQSKADLKTVMKATSLCFAEKAVYTQEVLAVVMQQLMDVTPLPTLLMRTVIQSLSLYPRLSGFVMNILQRLILKQVWKHKVVWEGFIKCCQRTKPQSFQVLLQLPPTQLSEALTTCPDLRTPLLDHVQSFTEVQRAHLPTSVMDVLLGRISENTENGTHLNTEPSEVITNEPLPPGME